MSCGGPRASAWNLGNYGNRQQIQDGISAFASKPGKNGKVRRKFFSFILTEEWKKTERESHGTLGKHSLTSNLTESQEASLYFLLYFLFIYSPSHFTMP